MPEEKIPISAVTIPWYTREDYPRILAISKDADDLPGTFDEWLAKATKVDDFVRKSGKRVFRVITDSGELAAWCAARNLDVDSKARNAFTTFKVRGGLLGTSN